MERRSAWAPALVWMEVELWRLELWGGALARELRTAARELPITAGKGDQRGDLALDWSGVDSRRGRTPEMRTTKEPGEGEEGRNPPPPGEGEERGSPGEGKERRRKTMT